MQLKRSLHIRSCGNYHQRVLLLLDTFCFQDNKTDSEKLRGELQELTRRAEQDAEIHRQETEGLQAQVENLTQRLNKVTTELRDVVANAIEHSPPSADGIPAGEEGKPDKLLEYLRSKYLEKVTELCDLKENHEIERNEMNERFNRKTKELTEKIHEKNRQLMAQRDSHSQISRTPTGSFDDDPDKPKPPGSVLELEKALLTKDKEIQSLTVQLQTFQQVASQRKQLQEHSKTQSAVVVTLRKDLEAAQVCLSVCIIIPNTNNYLLHAGGTERR